jgi:hypothetical protein
VHAVCAPFAELILRRGILDGRRGVVMAALQAQYTFNKYVTLWTMGLAGEAESAEFLPLHLVETPEFSFDLSESDSPPRTAVGVNN